MIRRFVGERYFCGLDIGTHSVKAALIQGTDHRAWSLLGVYETKTNGYKDGSVSDLEDLVECIHATVAGLSRKTKIKLKEVELGIGGPLVAIRPSYAAIPLIDRGNKVITHQDLKKIHSQAKLLGINMDEVMIHQFPQTYKIDDINVSSNPLGLYGRKLEMNGILVLAKDTPLKNLVMAVNQAGYDVTNLFFASYACSGACLTMEQKRDGCILVDIGSSFTNVLMFKEGQIRALSVVPVGGDQITKEIAGELNLTYDLAEEIKKSYGFLAESDQRDEEDILIKRDEGYFPIKKRSISQAGMPVSEQLVAVIVGAVKDSQLSDQMNVGILMIGGGALLPGLPERLEQQTNLLVRTGQIPGTTRKLHDAPKFASAVGLARAGYRTASGDPLQRHQTGRGWGRIVHRIRELYQEYF